MEISFDTIVNIISLLIGGGGGAFFTWRWVRKKAKAEAESAEINAAKEVQDLYQQMVQDQKGYFEDSQQHVKRLREERNHYMEDRDKLLDYCRKLETEIDQVKRDVARNGRMVESLRPFICTDLSCKLRKRGVIFDETEIPTSNGEVCSSNTPSSGSPIMTAGSSVSPASPVRTAGSPVAPVPSVAVSQQPSPSIIDPINEDI